jgi:hypothetical protein
MPGGINILPIFLIAWLAAIAALLIPSKILGWNSYQAYTLCFLGCLIYGWYFTDLNSAALITVATAQFIAQHWGCEIQRKKPLNSFSTRKFSIALLAFSICAPLAIEAYKHIKYSSLMPPEVKIGTPIYIPRQVNSNCEIIAWNLTSISPITTKQENWHKTPYPASDLAQAKDHWLNGLGCSTAPMATKDKIIDSLQKSGSIYSSKNGILLSQKEGIAALFLTN